MLAYSTVSQQLYVRRRRHGAYTAGVFHLMTHAFFKAGLFLGAGSVMHAMGGEGRHREDGRTWQSTYADYPLDLLCLLLAIAGIVPFAGFFFEGRDSGWRVCSRIRMAGTMVPWRAKLVALYPKLLWAMLAVAAMCTAFYVAAVLHGVHGQVPRHRGQEHHLHESPLSMTPLTVLAIGSVLAGLIGVPAV